jgi:hypothetical protein
VLLWSFSAIALLYYFLKPSLNSMHCEKTIVRITPLVHDEIEVVVWYGRYDLLTEYP